MFRLIRFAAVPTVLLAALVLTVPEKAQALQCGNGGYGYQSYGYRPYYSSYYPSYGYGYNVYRPPVYGFGPGFRYPNRLYGFPTGTYGFYRW